MSVKARGQPIGLRGRAVGYVVESTFYTNRNQSTFMRKYGGFGISAEVLAELIQKHVDTVAFVYEGEREHALFRIPVARIPLLGEVEKDLTFGFEDKQFFVGTTKMEKTVLMSVDFHALYGGF